MMKKSFAALTASLAAMLTHAANAQLISSEVRGDQRVCIYVGSPTLPNDATGARGVTVGLGQECPVSAPYSDPDAPIPSNAALRSETTDASNRTCTYEQGGVDYRVTIPVGERCAMTPGLLEREQQQRDAQR
jgi:hypothetical protein